MVYCILQLPFTIKQQANIDAVLIASKILESLNYVGVLGVELFHMRGLIVNEIAPRVHNSGHWTQNGCSIDQFEQHIKPLQAGHLEMAKGTLTSLWRTLLVRN